MMRLMSLAPLLAALFLALGSPALSVSVDAAEVAGAPATGNLMLHTVGSTLVDPQGKPVILHGVNLGGWLLWAGWMFGEGFVSESHMVKQLNSLVGFEATPAFRHGVYSNFIGEADLRRIAELGFNSAACR